MTTKIYATQHACKRYRERTGLPAKIHNQVVRDSLIKQLRPFIPKEGHIPKKLEIENETFILSILQGEGTAKCIVVNSYYSTNLYGFARLKYKVKRSLIKFINDW